MYVATVVLKKFHPTYGVAYSVSETLQSPVKTVARKWARDLVHNSSHGGTYRIERQG